MAAGQVGAGRSGSWCGQGGAGRDQAGV